MFDGVPVSTVDLLVLGVSSGVRRDGVAYARVLVAMSPQMPNVRGLEAVYLEADPSVEASFKTLPAVYRLRLRKGAVRGYGTRRDEVREVVVGAELIGTLALKEAREVKTSA